MIFKNMVTEKTSNPKTTKEKMIYLFEKSDKYIWMSSGFNSEFYTDKDIMSAMTNAFERVEEIRILIQGNITENCKWLFKIKSQFGDKLQIKQNINIPHWLIVDGKHFRLEKYHTSGAIGDNNLFVTDINQPFISDVIKRKYEDWWFEGKNVDD